VLLAKTNLYRSLHAFSLSTMSHVEHNGLPTYDAPHANLPTYRVRSHSIEGDPHLQPHYDVPPAYQGRTRRSRTPREISDSAKTEHLFELMNGKAKPWASLKLQSNAKGPQQIPTFFDRQAITGTVNLIVSKDDPIQSVSVTVRSPLTLPYFLAIADGGNDSGDWSTGHGRFHLRNADFSLPYSPNMGQVRRTFGYP
jgi:hypothetical protein